MTRRRVDRYGRPSVRNPIRVALHLGIALGFAVGGITGVGVLVAGYLVAAHLSGGLWP